MTFSRKLSVCCVFYIKRFSEETLYREKVCVDFITSSEIDGQVVPFPEKKYFLIHFSQEHFFVDK